MRITKIIWIENDDGSISLDSLSTIRLGEPSISFQDIKMASLIITDKGRILKNRSGYTSDNIPSFDLVKGAKPESIKIKPKKTKAKYRSIYDPSDIKEDL